MSRFAPFNYLQSLLKNGKEIDIIGKVKVDYILIILDLSRAMIYQKKLQFAWLVTLRGLDAFENVMFLPF